MSWEQRPSGTGNGCALVVVKDAKIKGFMEANGIHLRKKTRCSSSTVDEAAQEAGRAAGDRVSFGRPVTGEAAMLRIGRGHAVNPLVRRVRPSQE